MTDKIGIKVGHDKEAVEATKESIMAILEARADQKTIRAALKTFTTSMSISDISIQDSSISMPEDHSVHNHYPEPPEQDDPDEDWSEDDDGTD